MFGGSDDPRERRASWVRFWLSLVEAAHHVWGSTLGFVAAAMTFGAVAQMLERFGNWGVLSKWDVDRLVWPLALLTYCALTVRFGLYIGKRTAWRSTMQWSALHALTVIGLPSALFTWLVLTRESVKEAYRDAVPSFEPRVFPPPLPIPVLPLEPGAVVQQGPTTS
jgi:hypothetical protein